jgi:transcriptional regulator with XRE-family HTH domain
MNDVQETISNLREQGWTIQAVADELGVHRESMRDWITGRYYPSHAKLVLAGLAALLDQRPPKRKRYPGTHHLQRKNTKHETA